MNRILLGVGVIASATIFSAAVSPSFAAPVQAGTAVQLPTVYRFTVGDAQVMALSDCTISIDLHQVMAGVTPAEIDTLLASNFKTNPLETSINVFLVRLGGRTILIDTGLGDPKRGGCGKTFDAMAAAGIQPDQVSDIVITHLHLDHSGGLSWDGKVMFPNATIHVSEAELDLYRNPPPGQTGRARQIGTLVLSNLKPYIDAGKIKAFNRSGEILPGLSAKILPGHTPGSALYTLTRDKQELVFIGDYNPVPVVGFHYPEATFITDDDRVKSRAARLEMLKELARSGALVAAPHLSFPGIGHVGVEGSHFRWIPIDFSNRSPDTPTAKF